MEPGAASTSRPICEAASAVEKVPEGMDASAMNVARESAAMTGLRRGKVKDRGGAPQGWSDRTAPPEATVRSMSAALERG